MQQITWVDKDNTLPEDDVRRQWRTVDSAELKAKFNANVAELPSVIQAAVDALIGGAPGALDTLNELAAALNDDASFSAAVASAIAGKQPLDSDLTAIAALSPGENDVIQRKSGAWINRTTTQVKTDLVLTKADVQLSDANNTSDADKPLSDDAVAALAGKQATLVSATNIKTLNGNSLLGAGNLDLIADSITEDVTTSAPNQAQVFDALADKASIQYVDDAALGFISSWKVPVRLKTTGNVTLSGEQTLDGSLTSTDDVLVGSQTDQTQNGIYTTAAGAWSRRADANSAAELEGAAVTVQEGATQANTNWVQQTDNITLGTSNIVWGPLGQNAADATPTVKGIARLYTSTGPSTDGTMDRNSITNALAAKQALLVSATNIKTLNSASLLGAGDIDLTAFVIAVLESGLIYFSDAFTGTGTLEDPITIVGGAPSFITRETPAGAIPGLVYTLANDPILGSESLFRNGILQDVDDYTIVGAEIILASTLQVGEKLKASYRI